MYNSLSRINTRPRPWEFHTSDMLWTDTHIARQMMSYHLNETVDAASRNPVFLSMIDGVSVGAGFTISLTIIGSIREILGAGSWFGMHVFWDSFEPFEFMVKAPGAFICLGILLGVMNFYSRKRGEIFIQT